MAVARKSTAVAPAPLKVTEIPEVEPLYQAILDAGQQAGLPFNPDYNGASQEGIAISQTTIAKGRRQSTAHCYLDPAKSRPNLRIVSEALAERLVFERTHCTGVHYTVRGVAKQAIAAREVIVSAGCREVTAIAGAIRHRPGRAPSRAWHHDGA